MRRFAYLLIIATLVMASTARAFDGKRKGFVVGGGLGFAPMMIWSNEDLHWPREERGLAMNLMLGYAWNEKNMLIYEGNYVEYFPGGNSYIGQGFDGVIWYHYFKPTGRTFFTAGGVGLYDYFTNHDEADSKLGVIGGAGYAFMRHFQLALYISAGKSHLSGYDMTHVNISFVIDAIAF